ncbi:MAG: aldo/keto reductase [Acidobacteriaceae bacterium]|nr:aldo/keto reductase [Acidobacteriaceae bacterium]
MKEKSTLIKLNNGVQMPALGLGVLRSSKEETPKAVETAIKAGYRLIDTAAAYLNEREVGDGIRRSGVDRSEIFVTTKLWLTHYGYESALRASDSSLRKLGLDYLDLYLLHWPVPAAFDATVESYRAAEKLLAEGRVRAIGVCNFSPQHLRNLMERTQIVPAVNQVELHPSFNQRELRETDAKFGITTQSWSPIGGAHRRAGDAQKDPLSQPAVLQIADKYRKTPAQIVLRWHVDHGLSAIPKSVRRERIEENIDIFDFTLSPEDLNVIDALDTGTRSGPDPEIFDANTYPVKVED